MLSADVVILLFVTSRRSLALVWRSSKSPS